jgi:adenylate kinase
MDIALIGPAGAGKGTCAGRLAAEYNFLRLVTGDLFRSNVQKRTALGMMAQSYILRGELVPDELVDSMIENDLRLIGPTQAILFDGFPRTISQAEFLDSLYQETGRKLELVIYLAAKDEIINERLDGRLFCHRCHTPYHPEFNPPTQPGRCDRCGGDLYHRVDDTPTINNNRLHAFRRRALPVLQYYQNSNRLIIIDANQRIEAVYRAAAQAVEAARQVQLQAVRPPDLAELEITLAESAVSPPAPAVDTGLDLIFIGAPGSGKGTHARTLCQALNLSHIASGDLFRDNLKRETDLGKLAQAFIERGDLVPDDITESMIRRRLKDPDTQHGFVLDGFPRTLAQAEALTDILNSLGRRLDGAIYLKVSDEIVIDRLAGRLMCRQCQASYHLQYRPPRTAGCCDLCGGELYQREDDKPETIHARLRTYHRQTAPVIDYYQRGGRLIEVDGEGELTIIAERIQLAAQSIT